MSKILIIEDDAGTAKAIYKVLETNNFSTIIAVDGLQGTTLAHHEKPDLIILDLILPVGGGLTTLRNLKMSVHTNTIPVIVISATDDNELKKEVNSLGIEAFIEKPFDADHLILKIQEILS